MPATLPRKLDPRPRKLSPRTLNPRPKVNPRPKRRDGTSGGAPVYITSASVMSTMLTLNFDQPVALNGVPAFTTDIAGPVPLSAVRPIPTRVSIIFSSSVNSATRVNIPFRDPAIRSASGGYVTSNRFALAA